MPRGRGRKRSRDPHVCPACGSKNSEVEKTWTLVSPIPDRYGRITVTIMGVLHCNECGHTWKAPIQKMKTGGDEEAAKKGEEPKRQGQVIVLDLDDIMSDEE